MTDTSEDNRAAATAMGSAFTTYAWHLLTTDPHARGLSAIRKLTLLAVARRADHTSHATGDYLASTADDLVALTRLPFSALIPALAALQVDGWLDGDDAGGYRPPSAAVAFTCGEPFDSTAAAYQGCLTETPEPTDTTPASDRKD